MTYSDNDIVVIHEDDKDDLPGLGYVAGVAAIGLGLLYLGLAIARDHEQKKNTYPRLPN